MKTAYESLVARAAALGLPKAFHRDLTVHDLAYCNTYPASRRFLWAIGETGTTIVSLDPHDNGCPGETYRSRTNAKSLVRTLEQERPAMHYWDGEALAEIDGARAFDLLMGLK